MTGKQYIRSYGIFVTGLYFLSLGIVSIVRSLLGTTPISSPNYVLSLNTPLTLGMWTTLTNLLMMLIQFFLLDKNRPDLKKCRLEILLQIPFSFLFSAFIDLNMVATEGLVPSNYPASLALLLGGCCVQAAGIVLEIKGHVVMMSAEGLVARLSERLHKNFGYVKIFFDTALVVIAVVLSLSFTGRIQGIREGTVIAAAITGYIVKILSTKVMVRRH